MGYADDTYAFAQDGASMAPKMGTIAEFLEVTGQGVNAKKSVAFDTTGEQPVGAELGGQPLPLFFLRQESNSLGLLICEVRDRYIVIYMPRGV